MIKPTPMERCIEPLSKDFEGALLGDARRSARLLQIVEALERDPASGFPRALGSAAELEGFYRFINNEAFSATEVFEPHRRATCHRAEEAKDVVVVHDTTTVEFKGETTRRGLGYTTALGRQGFMAHAALLMDADGLPLGLAHLETYTRSGRAWRARQKKRSSVKDAPAARESERWLRGVDAAEPSDAAFRAVHVMDAEADFFELLDHMHGRGSRYVVRAGQLARRLDADEPFLNLGDAVQHLKPLTSRSVTLSPRPKRTDKGRNSIRRHPPRRGRVAHLAIAGTTVRFRKTRYSDVDSAGFTVNVVRAWELKPAKGEPPVEWVLLTSEPIATAADLERVVDLYRARWAIEDFFKALKTGCSLERRQVESYDALCKVLAILAPIAWRLLHLRGLARHAPKGGVRRAFSDLELTLMTQAPAARGCRAPRTIADGLALLARLGGHLKNNGAPGWITLGRGYEQLLLLRMGWEIAMKSMERCDQ